MATGPPRDPHRPPRSPRWAPSDMGDMSSLTSQTSQPLPPRGVRMSADDAASNGLSGIACHNDDRACYKGNDSCAAWCSWDSCGDTRCMCDRASQPYGDAPPWSKRWSALPVLPVNIHHSSSWLSGTTQRGAATGFKCNNLKHQTKYKLRK